MNEFINQSNAFIQPSEAMKPERLALEAMDLTLLTARGFMRDVSSHEAYAAMFRDVHRHIAGCNRLTVVRDANHKPLAFAAISLGEYKGMRLFHLEGLIIDPSVQGNGFGSHFLRREMDECGADILAFHTQSQSMQKLGERLSVATPSLALGVAPLIHSGDVRLLPGGQPIDYGRYGGCLYGNVEAFAPQAIALPDFDFLRGDAIIFAGHVRSAGGEV